MDDQGPSLRVERFDYTRVGSEWAVLRLLAGVQRAPGAVHLAVELTGPGSDRVYAPARACGLEQRLGPEALDQLLWRAAFALPLDVVRAPAAGFSLVWADGRPELTLTVPRLRTIDPRLLILAQRLDEGGRGLTLGAARRRLAALATAVAVTATSAPTAAFAATRSRPTVGRGGTQPAPSGQQPPATQPTTTAVTAAITAAPSATTAVTPAVTAAPSATTAVTPAITPAPSTTTATAPPSTTSAPPPSTGPTPPAATTPAPPAATTPAAPTSTSTPPSSAPASSTPAAAATTPTPGRVVAAAVTTADTRRPRSADRQLKVTRVFSAPSHRPGATAAPHGTAHHTTGKAHHGGTAPAHHGGGAPAHHTGAAPSHHTSAPHKVPPAPIHPSGGAVLAPQPLPSVPVPSSGGLTPGAPGFTGPTSWTGSVAPDPALTGSVTNLSGLASNAYRPPSFLIPIYMQAGHRYGIPWTVLAAINSVETDYGRDLNTSSAGAVGWMQFEPGTWHEYGLAVDGHSVPNPYDPRDAIFSAARYLAAAGGATDIARGVYAYNHAGWYVDEVLSRASAIAHHAQYEHASVRHGTFSVAFATGRRRHPTVRYRGGVMSHYDRLIAAANMVSAANFPYLYGGGHEQPARFGPFDCSGSVSYVMQQAGYKVPTTVSGEIPVWRFPAGPGRVTIFYNPVHTFMRIGNRYFGTSGFARGPGGGAGWFDVNRLPAGYLSQFREVHVPRLGGNSFAPGSPTVARRGSSTPVGFSSKRLSTLGSFPAAR